MKETLKVLMMLGCFPMMLSAKEYKKSESLSLDKDGSSPRSAGMNGCRLRCPERYIRI